MKQLYIRINDAERIDYLLKNDAGNVEASGSAFHADQLPVLPADSDVLLIVPGEDVSLLSLNLPKTSRSQLLKAIPFALEERLIDDIADLHFTPGVQDAEGNLHVAVVKKAQMQQWLKRCQALGLYPNIAIPDYLAMPLLNDAWHIYLDGDTALFRQSEFSGWRVEQIQLTEMLHLSIEEQNDSIPEKIIIDYDDGNEHFDIESLGELSAIVKMADTHHFCMDLFIQGSIEDPAINLLHGEYLLKKPKNKQTLIWKIVVGLLIAWFAIYLLGNITEYFVYQSRLNKAQANVKQLYQQAFPTATSIVDPKLRIERALKQVQNSGSGGHFLNLLTRVGQSMQQQAGNITIENFTYRNNILTLSISVTNFQSLTTLTQTLKKQGLSVQQQNASTKGKTVTAQLIIGGTDNG